MNTGVPLDDRALHYGDGLFETIRFVQGRAPLWDSHMQRLLLGCSRLRLPAPDVAQLHAAAEAALGPLDDAVVKLIYSAGAGLRGYARPPQPAPRVFIQATPCVVGSTALQQVRWCQFRLAHQPQLAGIKHLNRLEQVLARQEWQDEAIGEGLMLDMQDQVAAATAGNVFVRSGGRWLTPPVDRCGIAGVARRWIIESFGASEQALAVADVAGAECMVVSNAVRGPRQVLRLADRSWPPDSEVASWRCAWNALFAPSARVGA